jgi:hypothetical protein
MDKADFELRRAEYLAKAHEALQYAADASGPSLRESFGAMARMWRDLADQMTRKLAESDQGRLAHMQFPEIGKIQPRRHRRRA